VRNSDRNFGGAHRRVFLDRLEEAALNGAASIAA
jgi:hypothetical protein